MRYIISHKTRAEWGITLLTLLFIFSPILSAQPDAHPGALYVVPIVLPVVFMALNNAFVKPNAQNLYAVLLFLFSIISTLISDTSSFGTGLFKYLVFIIYYICISSFIIPPKPLRLSFALYLYLSIVISVLIILSYVFGYPHIMESSGYQGRYSIGITGLFKNPNYLTSFYNVSFFVICYILSTVKLAFKKRIVLISILALLLISSFFSGTRAALVVELLILVTVPIVMLKSKRYYRLIPFVLIIIIVLVNYWTDILDLYDLFMGSRDIMGDTSREDAWTYAFKYIKDNLIFGCGYNSWSHICLGTSFLEYLHNIFLELFLDQGIIGLLLVIGIVTTGFRRTNKKDRVFLLLLLFVTAFPLLFQNGLYEVNFWRFIIINRLMMNVSAAYEGGIDSFLRNVIGVEPKNKKKSLNDFMSNIHFA